MTERGAGVLLSSCPATCDNRRSVWQDPVMDSVDAAWLRIEAWLAGHAPATLATLRPPAGLDQIEAAEAELGMSFPADVIASLRRHDGARLDRDSAWTCFELPPFFRPLPVEEVRFHWRTRAKAVALTEAEHGDMSWHWDRRWIPVAASRGADCRFVVGERASPRFGRLGRAYHADPAQLDDPQRSLALLLQAVADSLEQEVPVEGCWPFVNAHGGLDWKLPGQRQRG